MFKTMKKRIKNEKGLTLIELLAVIVILAIVAAIAVPAIGNIIDNSRYNAVKADGINVLNAANIYYTDNSDAADNVTVQTLINEKYLDAAGKIPTEATISKDVPRKLTTDSITNAVGSKSVTFASVTIDDINKDNKKGSEDGDKTISPVTSGTP
ncbi:prepilin-type N-terminal cleavage/methylation domain-containing protein [Bacillus ndiopicus]|uniref:prepilin-type N-terminal cleavage/methylation domain-containing protein n=1 Tax=Bacillus ndiopicus TaxID=1347368 RepID=UPI000693D724|nr:prepilin-type N-terminal cleavage/methylation domain-containing protein [Bacillus ndiopicus]